MKNFIIFLSLILIHISIDTLGQTFDDPQDQYHLSGGINHIGELLLLGAKEGKIKLLSFENEDQEPREITVNDISLTGEEYELFDWNEDEIYFGGELVKYGDNQYISTVDDNIGNEPTESESWDIWEEIWAEIYGANYFFIETDANGNPTFVHLYHQYSEDEPSFTYLASFHASEAQNYLNQLGYLYYQTDDFDHLIGPLFLPPGEKLYRTLAEIVDISDLSDKYVRYSSFANEWHFVFQNLASQKPYEQVFIYGPDSLMQIVAEDKISSLEGLHNSDLYLLGDALLSGKTFGELSGPISNIDYTTVDIITTNITEQLFPVDSLYLKENGSKKKSPVSFFDVSMNDWTEFVDNIIESTKDESIKAYTNSDLNQKMTLRDFELRLMISEEDMIDWDFEVDEWDKEIRYFMGDKAEYAGVKYESTQDENENHMPSQWPEYWQPADENLEFFYPNELQVLWVKSKLSLTKEGIIEEIEPMAFALIVPGYFVLSGIYKEIAWFDVAEIAKHTSTNPIFVNIMKQIREHDFYARILDFDTIQIR